MTAKVIDLEKWKRSHPPAVVCLQHGIDCALAWQRLFLLMPKVFISVMTGKNQNA